MRLSRLLSKTLREDPSEAETASHRLMLRAGMLHQVAAGVYAYLPLALRSLAKIERIIREEMDAAGGQEVRMPALHPLDLWQATGRDQTAAAILFQLRDRRGRDLLLAPTHEEVVTSIVKANAASYRDLPLLVYQIQTKFRDEPRPRAGLLRGREFDMKDAYSFDADWDGLDRSYRRMVEAYSNVFRRCGLPTMAVEADSGAIGGKDSHEFIMPAESGEDVVLYCAASGYAANVERAKSIPPPAPQPDPLPLTLTDTPGVTTIPDLARLLGIPEAQTLKAVFYQADGETVLVTIRGDLEVNDVKLKNHLRANDLRLAGTEEVRAAGLTPGSTSPIGIEGVRTIADESIGQGANFAAGANQPDKHYVNVNYPRDFTVGETADVARAQAGHGSPDGAGALEEVRGVEVGHVFKLGEFYADALGAAFVDADGASRSIVMGCYGIGVTRLLAAAIEQNHDERGIVFPPPIAPYHVHLVSLNPERDEVRGAADRLYDDLRAAGLEVLYDDRAESPGVKFNDADLLGLPVRVVVSPRNLRDGVVELRPRRGGDPHRAPAAEAASLARTLLGEGER